MTLENISKRLQYLNFKLFDDTSSFQEALIANQSSDILEKLYNTMTMTLDEIKLHHEYARITLDLELNLHSNN